MAFTTYQIFLASRFEEFFELRRALKDKLQSLKNPSVEVIDLNDNAANPKPPLPRCYSEIDNAELFVLLVGETYGEVVHNQQSYTHLEYWHALKTEMPILPFVIRDSSRISNSSDGGHRSLNKWIAEIEKHHTLSRLDVNLDVEQLANLIFEQVRERFVELYRDGDLAIPDDVDEPSEREEAIIKRERLATAIMQSREVKSGESILRNLTNDHSKEALKALELGFHQIAIHHLQKAIDMAPLDVVLGYWLSRLLVATGRHSHCVTGRRIALRCAQVAAIGEEQKLEAMACQIVAARASERIGELEVAREYVRRAHEAVPYHWLVKFEYARQLALAGDRDNALSFAEEAFWLQPYTILRVQTDSAFTGLGKAYNEFRAQLRQSVEIETAEVARIEKLIRQFSAEFGIVSPQAAVHPTDLSIPDRKEPIIDLVRNAKRSMKGSLQLLQLCACRLSAEQNEFITGESKVQLLYQEHAEAMQNQRQLGRGRMIVLGVGSLLTVVLFLITVSTVYLSAYVMAVLGLILAVIVVIVTCVASLSIGPRLVLVQQKIDHSYAQLEEAKNSLADLRAAEQRFEATELRLRKQLAVFTNLVSQFELIGLRRLPFSPARPIDRKGTDDLVRADRTKVNSQGLAVDVELLPAPLRFLSPSSSPSSRYWLARKVRLEATDAWSRSAAYFHPVKVKNLHVYKDGIQTGPFTAAQINASLQAGHLTTNDYVWYEGGSDWIRLSAVPEIGSQ